MGLTGKSVPGAKGVGNPLYGSSVVVGGSSSLLARSTATGSDMVFPRVVALVEEAQAHQAPVQISLVT
jgi:cation transport ATPase